MKKRILIGTIIVLAVMGIILFVGGCSLFQVHTSPVGQLIDVKTGEGISGATVKLVYDTTGATEKDQKQINDQGFYEAISTTTGEFDYSNEEEQVPYGDYNFTAEKDGYVFFEQKISITSLFPDLGLLSGMQTTATGLALVLMWNDTFHDVDAYLTYPEKGQATVNGAAPALTTPYDTGADELSGFSPETFAPNTAIRGAAREVIYFTYPSTAADSSSSWDASTYTNTLNPGTPDLGTGYYIQLDVDATQGGGPETITIQGFPFSETAADLNTTGGGTTGLPTGTYTWVGVIEYYANAFASDYSDVSETEYLSQVADGSASADAILWVVSGTTIIGKYTVPDYTQIKTANLVRINCFYDSSDYEFMQIVPNIQVLQSTDEIRGLDDSGIINVRLDNNR